MISLLDNLNQEQLSAVTHATGPLLIVAGAGTGKTTVITRRIAYLIQQGLASPDQILALTFTEKAASEMAERVDLLLPLGTSEVWISTFHAFCERLLKQHALDIGIPNDFELLGDTAQWVLLYKHFQNLSLDYYRPLGNPSKFLDALLKHFSKCKDELITPEDYLAYAESLKLAGDGPELLPTDERAQEIKRVEELANAFHAYQQLLLNSNALDFGDLINYTLALFTKRPNILDVYRKQFKFILVDEFQDTNFAQYQLVKLLSGTTGNQNIVVVGDDDQSIYKFRGASVSNILKFKNDFPSVKELTLVQNYRSSQEILDLAYDFIKHNNPDRLEVQLGIQKKLTNPDPKPATIAVLEGQDLSSELDMVIKKILEIKQADNCSWNDFAILIRSNSASEEIIPKLEAVGVPYTFLANRGLYRKPLIQNILSYLKLLNNFHESAALYQVLRFPKFHLSTEDLSRVTQFAHKYTLSLYETLTKKELVQELSEPAQHIIAELLRLLDKHANMLNEKTAVESFVFILKDLDILTWLGEDTFENAQNREYLEQFYKKIEDFEQEYTDSSMRNFLHILELELQAGDEGEIKFDPNSGPESLKLMTIHSAKGLEFENVFIINMVDQRFPTRQKRDAIELPAALIKDTLPEGDFHIQEERRLFYVAITRAKRKLFFSWARNYGGSRTKKPSSFLIEANLIPSDKVSKATGKVVLTKPPRNPKDQIYKVLPKSFSYSEINTFLNCPLQYKYSCYLKLPLPGSAALSFGSTIHKVFQRYLEEYVLSQKNSQHDLFGAPQIPTLPPFERLEELYASEWIDEWYLSKEQKEQYRTKGANLLKIFHKASLKNIPQPKYLEAKFKLKLGSYDFVGKIDRADKGKEGLVILDYKTGKKPKNKGDEDLDQLKIYQLAAQDFLAEKVESLAYWYLEEDHCVPVPLSSGEELLKLQEELLVTIEEIIETIKYDTFAERHKKQSQHLCNFQDWV